MNRRSLAAAIMFGVLALAGSVSAAASAPPEATPTAKIVANMPEKLVVTFQKQKDPQALKTQADAVAAFLSAELGMPVETVVPSNYSATVQALISNRAQVAYVSSLPYILAAKEAPVKMVLAEVRKERTDYDSIFVVAVDSPIKSLEDLRGKRMMFTSTTSTSGYLMAYSRLVDEGLLQAKQPPAEFFSQIGYAGGYDRALLAVANGQADVCAVSDYTMEGEKADVYLSAEQRAKLRILARTPGVPTHGVCLRSDLPEELQKKIVAALMKMSTERSELLSDVYGAASFRPVSGDEHVIGAMKALENTGANLKDFAN